MADKRPTVEQETFRAAWTRRRDAAMPVIRARAAERQLHPERKLLKAKRKTKSHDFGR